MDQALNALRQHDKSAEVADVGDFAFDQVSGAVFLLDRVPGVLHQVLAAQADALALDVDVGDLDFDLIADIQNFGGVVNPAPVKF